MNYLGIDYGQAKIGLAKAVSDAPIAIPFSVLKNKATFLEDLENIVAVEDINQLVVGYPLNLAGEVGGQAKDVDIFIEKLKFLGLPIAKQDERFSSKSAVAKGDDDASAATLILQTYLDSHIKISN